MIENLASYLKSHESIEKGIKMPPNLPSFSPLAFSGFN